MLVANIIYISIVSCLFVYCMHKQRPTSSIKWRELMHISHNSEIVWMCNVHINVTSHNPHSWNRSVVLFVPFKLLVIFSFKHNHLSSNGDVRMKSLSIAQFADFIRFFFFISLISYYNRAQHHSAFSIHSDIVVCLVNWTSISASGKTCVYLYFTIR